jgi:integrase
MAAIGRPKRHHVTADKITIPGLGRIGDGKWRITEGPAKGKRFNEKNELLAIAKFRQLSGQSPAVSFPVGVMTAAAMKADTLDGETTFATEGDAPNETRDAFAATLDSEMDAAGNITLSHRVNEAKIWEWCREQIIADRVNAARQLRLPGVANLDFLPRPPIKLIDLIAVYRDKNASCDRTKYVSVAILQRLIDHAGAITLDDLTQDKLNAFRAEIEATIPGPATRSGYYGKIKSIISFGLKVGLDAIQIRTCLDRCKVLWTAAPMPSVNPKPISREDFHTLLASGNGSWRPWLLLGLNLCLHMNEVCGLKWADFDLVKGTYAAIREKTKRHGIPRAATLWPETLAVLKAMPRRSEYVFTSMHGTRHNRNARVTDFAKLRKAAGLPDDVTFDTLRDGSYTAAVRGTEEKWARVLAGHASPGLQDSYVLRNPEAVRPATDAVYAAYGPFPTPAAQIVVVAGA